MITKIKAFSSEDINELHQNAVTAIFGEGRDFEFGDKDERKKAREVFCVLQIYGRGIKDVLNCKSPKGFLWDGKKVRAFAENSLREVQDIRAKGIRGDFEYTYPELIINYPNAPETCRDQMTTGMIRLAADRSNNVMSNRNVGVVFNPIFWDKRDMPCFNWFQIRYLGDNKISLRLLFRSHDYGSAVWANLSMILNLVNEEMKRLNDPPEIEEVILTSASAHVYENDKDLIEKKMNVSWKRFLPGWWKPNKRLG